jgi:predicted nucleic acid-binding protein
MGMGTFYLLDTNILVALVRGGKLGRHTENTYGLSKEPFKPLISVVTVGESLKLVREFGWGQVKIDRLWNLLQHYVWVDINNREVFDAYAEIADHCERNGRTKPQNDYWIAATARVTGATLLTTDKHFDDLHGEYLQRIWIDEGVEGG